MLHEVNKRTAALSHINYSTKLLIKLVCGMMKFTWITTCICGKCNTILYLSCRKIFEKELSWAYEEAYTGIYRHACWKFPKKSKKLRVNLHINSSVIKWTYTSLYVVYYGKNEPLSPPTLCTSSETYRTHYRYSTVLLYVFHQGPM